MTTTILIIIILLQMVKIFRQGIRINDLELSQDWSRIDMGDKEDTCVSMTLRDGTIIKHKIK